LPVINSKYKDNIAEESTKKRVIFQTTLFLKNSGMFLGEYANKYNPYINIGIINMFINDKYIGD